MSEGRRYGTFRVVLKGGEPWGITLAGGVATLPLQIAKVEPGGKASVDGHIRAGDHVLRVNDIPCEQLVEARQMINSAFYTLTLTLWRGNVAVATGETLANSNQRLHVGAFDGNSRDHEDVFNDEAPSPSPGEYPESWAAVDDPFDLTEPADAMEKHQRSIRDHNSNERYPQSFAHKTTGPARPAAAHPLAGLRQTESGGCLPSASATATTASASLGEELLQQQCWESGGSGRSMNAAKPAPLSVAAAKRNGSAFVYDQPVAAAHLPSGFGFQPTFSRPPQQLPPPQQQQRTAQLPQPADAVPSWGKENRGPTSTAAAAGGGHGRWRSGQPDTASTRYGLGSASELEGSHVVDAFGFMTGSLLPSATPPLVQQKPKEPLAVQGAGRPAPAADADQSAASRDTAQAVFSHWQAGPSEQALGSEGARLMSFTSAGVGLGSNDRQSAAASRWIHVTSRALEARHAKVAKVEHATNKAASHEARQEAVEVATVAAARAAAARVTVDDSRAVPVGAESSTLIGGTAGITARPVNGTTPPQASATISATGGGIRGMDSHPSLLAGAAAASSSGAPVSAEPMEAPVSVRSIVSVFERPDARAAPVQHQVAALRAGVADAAAARAGGGAPCRQEPTRNSSGCTRFSSSASMPGRVWSPPVTAAPVLDSSDPAGLTFHDIGCHAEEPARTTNGYAARVLPVDAAPSSGSDEVDMQSRRIPEGPHGHSWSESSERGGGSGCSITSESSTGACNRVDGSGATAAGGSRRQFASHDDATPSVRSAPTLNRTASFAGTSTGGALHQRPVPLVVPRGRNAPTLMEVSDGCRFVGDSPTCTPASRDMPMKRAASDFFGSVNTAKILTDVGSGSSSRIGCPDSAEGDYMDMRSRAAPAAAVSNGGRSVAVSTGVNHRSRWQPDVGVTAAAFFPLPDGASAGRISDEEDDGDRCSSSTSSSSRSLGYDAAAGGGTASPIYALESFSAQQQGMPVAADGRRRHEPFLQQHMHTPSKDRVEVSRGGSSGGSGGGSGSSVGSTAATGHGSTGGGAGDASTRRLKRAVSTNILPSRGSAAAASGIGSSGIGIGGMPRGHRQQPLPPGGSSAAAREAQLNEYNERLSRQGTAPAAAAAVSGPSADDMPSLPPRSAGQHGYHMQAAMIAAHQHFHSMSALPASADHRSTGSQRAASYRPPQTSELHCDSPFTTGAAATDSESRPRPGANIRRVESYRVVPTTAAAATADGTHGGKPEDRDRSKQEIRQSLLDFYMQKTRRCVDGGAAASALDAHRDSDSPPFSAPADALAWQSPYKLSRDMNTSSNRSSIASSSVLAMELDSTRLPAAAQLRRTGSFSSIAAGAERSSSSSHEQMTRSSAGGVDGDGRGWLQPSPFADNKFVASHHDGGVVGGKVKKLPVAEVSPFSRTRTVAPDPCSSNGFSVDQAHNDSGPLPSTPVAASPGKASGLYVYSSSSEANHRGGPPSPGSPPVLPPRNYRFSGEVEAKPVTVTNYEAMLPPPPGAYTASDKMHDGQQLAAPILGVRLRSKPAPAPPGDMMDGLGTGGDDMDNEYRKQLRRASASQYKRASLSAASTSSQLSSPGGSSPTNRKSFHADGDIDAPVVFRQHGGGSSRREDGTAVSSRPGSGIDEARQRWSSCEVSSLAPQTRGSVDHTRQGSLSCASPGFSNSRSPAADDVFSARSSPLAVDDASPSAVMTAAATAVAVAARRGSRGAEPQPGFDAKAVPGATRTHRRSSSVAVETASAHVLSHAGSISSLHSHSTSVLRADQEVATVLQLAPDPSAPTRQRAHGAAIATTTSVTSAATAGIDMSSSSSRFGGAFKPISVEIMENLKGLGISVSEKRLREDVTDGGAQVPSSPPATVATTVAIDESPATVPVSAVSHVRQKSQEEILCDSKMQILAQSIDADDAAVLSHVLAPPEGFRQASDYLSGVFDDVLRREHQRKARLSSSGGVCADKTGSSASPASLEFDNSSRGSPGCDSGISCRQSPSAGSSQVVRQSSSGNGDTDPGSIHSRLHEWLQNQDYCSSPDAGDGQKKKAELIAVLHRKLDLLRSEKETREAALKQNESAGEAVAAMVTEQCSERDASKYRSYVEDLDKVTKLLLKLSRRLARAENDVRAAAAATGRPADEQQKAAAEQRRDSLRRQHDDALMLKDGIDRQRKAVGSVLLASLSAEQYEQYEAFVGAKVTLIMEQADVEDKIAFGEEQLSTLQKFLAPVAAAAADT